MEDTHAYLYNFLSTPAPKIPSATDSETNAKKDEASKDGQDSKSTHSIDKSVVETDNGYFAIFDACTMSLFEAAGYATIAPGWPGERMV